MDGPFRCSDASAAAGEPMLGTASTIRRWLLLEHDGPWGANALRDARMPRDVRRRLLRAERDLGIRVLLIRRPDRRSSRRGIAVAAVDTSPPEPWIERTELDGLADLAAHDLAALRAGGSIGWARADGPIFVVCTQGRRDPCCAERGRPLAAALARDFPDETWEATHVGGDRFAGNMVIFPEGLYFGRVGPDEAVAVATTHLDGRIHLEHFRGRAGLPMEVQAAEHVLRIEIGLDRIDAVRFGTVARDGALVLATFDTPLGPFRVSLERGAAEARRLTCHADGPVPAPAYAPLAIERLPPRREP